MEMKHFTFCSGLTKNSVLQPQKELSTSLITTLWSKVECMSIMPVKDKIPYVSENTETIIQIEHICKLNNCVQWTLYMYILLFMIKLN